MATTPESRERAFLRAKIVEASEWFASEIRGKLCFEIDYKDKRDWVHVSSERLFFRLLEEVTELYEIISKGRPSDDAGMIIQEAVDVAALAMFIADNVSKRGRE